ncbi:acetylornithine deacetylase [Roseovarius sp. HI0049]|nr:acetylornithine deacetylase [Roseovarius sp. HI0049]
MTRTLEHLERLVGFDTVSHRSNLAIIDYIEGVLQTLGLRTTRLPDASGRKAGLYAETGPGDGGILLSGHTDVVPVEGQEWTRDPFRLTPEGDRLYGRGTTDMKGYLACMLSAAELAAGQDLREPLKLVFSHDEEIGCVGIQQMEAALAPLLGQPRACIVGEPTQMQVAIGHKGKAAWRAVCHGQAGHSALAPGFVNALHLAGDFMAELRALQAWLKENGARDAGYDIPYSTVHVGQLSGGLAVNMVPDRAEMHFELRYLAADPAAEISQRIAQATDRVAGRYQSTFPDARITLDQTTAYPGLDVAEDAEVTHLARTCAQSDLTKVAFGTEAGVFDRLGIPTIVCGPGDMAGQGHKADEYVTTGQLDACDRMMARLVEEISR